jgi:hypothetical protein
MAVGSVLMLGPAFAADPPDSKVNPASGKIETVDALVSESDLLVRHIIDHGQGEPQEVTYLTNNSVDDLSPKLEINASGDSWVVWWRDAATDQIFYRKRDYSSGNWSSEVALSDSTESSRNPEIVNDGTDAWVAFEFDDIGGTTIVVGIIKDEPDPFGNRTSLGTTTYSGSLDTLIHYKSGNLWVTWIDSADEVGWSQYDYANETWSTVNYESYGDDTVPAARARIRTEVLGN